MRRAWIAPLEPGLFRQWTGGTRRLRYGRVMTLLVTAWQADRADAQAQALRQAGVPVAGSCGCRDLLREVVRQAPQAVLLWAPEAGAADWSASLAPALAALADGAPCPVLACTGSPAPMADAPETDDGLWACLPVLPQASAAEVVPWLQANLPRVLARFRQQRQQQQALLDAQGRLDERKWIDRAKGLLMRHQQLAEDDAFALLRTASMQANLRVGEVSRGLIEAAADADAINRAGQLRMLSQRVVKALALARLSPARSSAQRGLARTLLAESASRVADNLQHLGRLPLPADSAAALAREEAAAAWQALAVTDAEAALGTADAALRTADSAPAGPSADGPIDLALADQQAERLLAAAEALTQALEAGSGRRGLQVVNLAGRQRMLSQRLAKLVLLPAAQPGAATAAHWAAEAARSAQALEEGLATLQRAPLSSEPIRAALAESRSHWRRLQQAVQQLAGGDDAAARVVRDSEALLASFERLTSHCEHSMQVLLS